MLSKINDLSGQDKLVLINQVICGILVLSILPNVARLVKGMFGDGLVIFFSLFFPIIIFLFNKEILGWIKNASLIVNIILLLTSIPLTIFLILIAL